MKLSKFWERTTYFERCDCRLSISTEKRWFDFLSYYTMVHSNAYNGTLRKIWINSYIYFYWYQKFLVTISTPAEADFCNKMQKLPWRKETATQIKLCKMFFRITCPPLKPNALSFPVQWYFGCTLPEVMIWSHEWGQLGSPYVVPPVDHVILYMLRLWPHKYRSVTFVNSGLVYYLFFVGMSRLTNIGGFCTVIMQ